MEDPEARPRRDSLEVVSPNGQPEETEVGKDQDLSKEEVSEETVTLNNRQGLLGLLTKAIGVDITSIALPVTLNEGTSFLQRIVEQMMYCELLDKASLCEDKLLKLMYVSIFAVSCFASTERTAKPFNPLLGETFDFFDEKKKMRVMCEQISHHPPISALYAETDSWRLTMMKLVKSKFGGNSLEFVPPGRSKVVFKATGETFEWNDIRCVVHNVIVGSLWVDHFGEVEIKAESGEKAKLEFKRCGWFSKGWHEVDGFVVDDKDKPCIQIVGKWNESMFGKLVKPYTPNIPDSSDPKVQEFNKELKKCLNDGDPVWVHTVKPLPAESLGTYQANWSPLTLKLTEITEDLRPILPLTDSRLRTDRYHLERGDTKKAASEKHFLEERQREQRRQREAKKEEWNPKYFKRFTDDFGEFCEYSGGYFEDREKRIAAAKSS